MGTKSSKPKAPAADASIPKPPAAEGSKQQSPKRKHHPRVLKMMNLTGKPLLREFALNSLLYAFVSPIVNH
jgi:hypothetical protein